MKLRTVLNGIVALAVVGAFYTFAFCMTDEIDADQISGEYYYNTATETAIETEEAAVNIFTKAVHNVTAKENPDTPSKNEDELVEQQFAVNASYEAVTELPSTEVVITPLHDPDTETAVPEPEVTEPETETVSSDELYAKDNTDYDAVPEENDEDMIFSDNLLSETNVADNDAHADSTDSDPDLLSELDRQPSTEEIERRLEQMQENIDEAVQTSAPFYGTYPDDTEYISSFGTYFETTPDQSEAAPSETELTAVSPDGTEILTAKVGGTVQEFDAYQLVCMIVSTEMSPSFSPEALKAQAVAAYSYVKYHNVNGLIPTVLIKKDVPQQVTDAVNAVWGKCCYYNGNVAQTVYTASSAGTTASAVNVWGGEDVPYLISVATPFDAQSDPNYGIISTFSADYMRNALESSLGITLSDSPENWLTVSSRIDGNYVSGVNVDGQLTVSGRKIREQVLNFGIKSWCFDVSYADGEFTFITYGYGHGVGMSQNGANILGKQGYTYDQILSYYFPGITIY